MIYQQSELPPLPPNLEEKLAYLDTQIAGLICEHLGNYLALQKISEMLSDCTDTCDLNLNSIQVVADGPTVQPTLKDLSIKDKQLICSGFFTHSILLGLLSEITGNFAESLAPTLSVNAQIYSRPTTVSEFEKFRDELMESSPSNGNFFFKMLQPMNNLDSLTANQKRAIFATAMALHRACYLLSKFTTSSPERLLSAISNYVYPGVMSLSEDWPDEVWQKLLDPENVQPNGFSIICWSPKKGSRRQPPDGFQLADVALVLEILEGT